MSGPLSVPAAIAALWVENQTAKILLGVTAFVCIWAAAYAAWQKEHLRVLQLEAKLDSGKRLSAIADHLKVGQRLQTQKISSDDELNQFVTEYRQFVTDSATTIGNNFSAAEAQSFVSHPVVMSASIPGSFNRKHENTLLYLKEYVDRLRDLVARYGAQR
jgi:hypothetical protein